MTSTELWTLAILEATRIANVNQVDSDGLSPLAIFSKPLARLPISNEHAFKCPVCILGSPLQARSKITKRESRASLGMCVGKSHFHAKNVSLAMNCSTGLVPRQFHLVLDDNLTTVDAVRKGPELGLFRWLGVIWVAPI